MFRITTARRIGAAIGALLFLLCLIPGIGAAAGTATIEQRLLDQFAKKDEATYWVLLRQQADLSQAQSIKDWNTRGKYVYDTLRQTLRSQASCAELQRHHWTIVRSGFISTVRRRQATMAPGEPRRCRRSSRRRPSIRAKLGGTVCTGRDRVGTFSASAPRVWSRSVCGEGVVVANIDTGVAFSASGGDRAVSRQPRRRRVRSPATAG
jgi:hypothetical protein